MISAVFFFPIWIWHIIISCISHPHNPLILPPRFSQKNTIKHHRKHSGIHGYTLARARPQNPLSCSAEIDCQPHNAAEGRNWKYCNYALHEISQPRKKNTIEKLSIPEIRINTNQACMFWLECVKPEVVFVCVCVCVSAGGFLIKDKLSRQGLEQRGSVSLCVTAAWGGGRSGSVAAPPPPHLLAVNYIKGSHCLLTEWTPTLCRQSEGWRTDPVNQTLISRKH